MPKLPCKANNISCFSFAAISLPKSSIALKQDNTAFAFISCGPHAHTYKAEACIESLYKIAGWSGATYLITDSPKCFDPDKLREYCENDKIFIVTVPGFSRKLDVPLAIKKSNEGSWKAGFVQAWTRSKSKALKAQLLDLIPDKSIENIIYLDADALFVRGDLMEDLMEEAIDWPGEGVKFKVNKWSGERGQFDENCIIHTGFFIVNREKSKRALQVWDQHMSDKSQWIGDGTDKAKYMKGFRELKEQGADNFMMVYDLTRKFERVFKDDQNKSLITHITFPRIKEIGYDAMEDYISQFGLKSYTQGYYCLPGMPMWLHSLFYHGHLPYWGKYKIEDVWKRWRKFTGRHEGD